MFQKVIYENLTSTTVTLTGTIDPKGATVEYYFEYGETDSYGEKTDSKTFNTSLVKEDVSRLKPETIYHYRLVAVYSGKPSYYGKNEFFQTKYNKINGSVYYNGELLCAMVLANGQHMFSCDEENLGTSYELNVPLNGYGEIDLFAFVDGFAPYKITNMKPNEAVDNDINMSLPSDDNLEMKVTHQFDAATDNPDWIKISGTVMYGEIPLNAMVLVNGQQMFSSKETGEYELEVPLNENGGIVLQSFADGFLPYSKTLRPSFDNTLEMTFNLIPKGSFTMGSPDDEPGRNDNETPHQVTPVKKILYANYRSYSETAENSHGRFLGIGM